MKKIFLINLVVFSLLFSCQKAGDSQDKTPVIKSTVLHNLSQDTGGNEQVLDNDIYQEEEVFPGIIWGRRIFTAYQEKFLNSTNPQVVNILAIDTKKYSIHTGLLGDQEKPRKLAKTSEIAEEKQALIAINGGFFGFPNYSYSYLKINNIEISRNPKKRGVFGIYPDSQKFEIKILNPSDTWEHVRDAIGGWTILLDKGKNTAKANSKLEKDGSPYSVEGRNPRTAVGYNKDRSEIYFITVDGRQAGFSIGMTLPELSDLLQRIGVYESLNLDGGGSTCMYIQGKGIVNSPSDTEGERLVLSIVYAK